jgi:hypothetical protein
MATSDYHFGVPAKAVWTSHIIIGLFLLYIGYVLVDGQSLNKWIGVTLIVLGVLAALYHAHLWYISKDN